MTDALSLVRVSAQSAAARLRQQSGSFAEIQEYATKDPQGFWLEQAARVDWFTPPTLSSPSPDHQPGTAQGCWFSDGTLNMSVNALDRHVAAGRGDHAALITDSAMTGEQKLLATQSCSNV